MMIKKFLAFTLLPLTALVAEPLSSPYFKVGTELGLGYRYSDTHGFDISANITPLLVYNLATLKAFYLSYPFYEKEKLFYWGVGGGLAYEAVIFGQEQAFATANAVIGYEFHTSSVRPFLQLEMGVPFSSRTSLPVIPMITLGFRF